MLDLESESHTELKMHGFHLSGVNLIEEINALNPSKVIDVGCGNNFFKGKINNLIGFDLLPYPNADFVCQISEMEVSPNSIDVALALGPFQYKDNGPIDTNIATVVKWIKPGGYLIVRNMPFVNSDDILSYSSSNISRWSKDMFDLFTAQNNLLVVRPPVLDVNTNIIDLTRLCWWWQKQ